MTLILYFLTKIKHISPIKLCHPVQKVWMKNIPNVYFIIQQQTYLADSFKNHCLCFLFDI